MQSANSYRVLVVEDEGLIALDIATRLEALGHQVVGTVATAEEAIAQASAADLVLMDIRIDGKGDGIAAAQEVRARHRVPVVFLTAHADRATLERAKGAGPFGYIVKPLGPASLHTSIEMAVYKHRMESQLEQQEAWLRTTLASVADAIIVADIGGRVRILNQAAETLTGWTTANGIGQRLESVVRLVEEESGNDLGDPAPLAILRGAPVALDRGLRLISKDGREIAVEGTVAPVRSSSEALGVVLTLRDVSARRWEERQLWQAQRMEAAGRLAARVSTEYASLIQTIRSRTGQLVQHLGGYSPAQSALQEIREAALAAEQVTESLAGLGTRQAAQPEVVSLNAVLRRMSRMIETIAGKRVVTAIQPAPEAGRIKADPAQIERAIMNLVLHACSTLPEGGRLLIQTSRTEAPQNGALASFAAVSFDYAAPERDLEHLFDPAGSSQANTEAWALSLTHSIATEHGGYLTARVVPGGTRIELLLPRYAEELPPSELAPTPGQAFTILLVDGRDRVRAQLHNFFESAGYNLLEASDREEASALAQVHEGALDLLIADSADAAPLLDALRSRHPALQSLTMVDLPESSPREIRRPFTQQTLLERVGQVFNLRADL
jgi:two-component system, cell cycle sensor histidine kinase and response regulator CckA